MRHPSFHIADLRPAETDMHGDTHRVRRDVIPSRTSSNELVANAGQSDITKEVSSQDPHRPPCAQTKSSPSSWKDVLKSAIWHLLPPDYPGLSATELHNRLKRQEHELLKHQCNLKSFQSAIYTALNEMMLVYVDKRRLEGARNRHEYIALQRTQEAGTQVKERTAVSKSPDPAENIVLCSQHSTTLEPQETKGSPARKPVDTQAPSEAAAPQSLSGVRMTQAAFATGSHQYHRSQGTDMSQASAEQAHSGSSTDEARDDVVSTQSQTSVMPTDKRCDDKNQPSTPSTAPSTNSHTRLENMNSERDHTPSDNCLAETPSNALVLRTPTVLASTKDSSREMITPGSSRSIQSQGQQSGAALRVMQQASNQNSLADKSSRTTQALCRNANKTSEECEARTHRQGGSMARATASPQLNVAPTQQDKNANHEKPIGDVRDAQISCREKIDNGEDIKNAALMELGKKVERAYSLKTQCEKYKREKMGLQAQSQAKQTALAESINRANEDIAHFNEVNLRHQKLQAQLSDSERKLADARRQTSLSREVARRKDTECQTHAALMAQLADNHALADRKYQNEMRSLGLG